MVSKPKKDYLAPGTLVRRVPNQITSAAPCESTMVIVDVVPASPWGLGADESYNCYLPNGLVKRYYRYELYKVS